jgi:hypothetical protein
MIEEFSNFWEGRGWKKEWREGLHSRQASNNGVYIPNLSGPETS